MRLKMRCKDLTPFMVMDIVRDASKYEDAIHFEIGQPDLPPSPKVLKTLEKNLNKAAYTQSKGLEELRGKIAKHYEKEYGVSVDTSQIFLTPGTSGAFIMAYALTLSSGDILGLSDPSYPCYKNVARVLDIEPLFLPISKESSYELRKEDIKGKNIKAIQISSPANPTGNIYGKNGLKELIKGCKEEGISFISDELYHGLTYEKRAHSALEFDDELYVINGFSKYFCMPGFRLGWIIVPKQKLKEAEILAQNLFICPPTLSQYAALEAFDEEYLSFVRDTFRKRRDYLFEALSEFFTIDAKPEGAFYLWADISKYSNDSALFAKELLEKIHVAATPGVDFGIKDGKKYMRFAYTKEISHMREGVDRLRQYLSLK
ncbi:MAG: aminotransferase class I/II-fold pyridoxal phosphate-dependent enzyme [Sulfurospirillaceae bacterium]|jgi:aspartate/methionine/tyrosine aminotransferase|nr:aminotransferase class I/II-fold pyridoxal phosphate-dependent enzyme [Sulfurospirillaceae bacterium]MDY0237807.1 aminotransferase class I/II-fold pyridoxal phosphate-dependent enzyme [Campylobacterales bacterium]